MEKSNPNPFSVSSDSPPQRGAFSDHAVLLRSSFLFRVIDIDGPFVGRLTYSGWRFRQMVEIDGRLCWFRVSWLKIHSKFDFTLPESIAINPAWGGGGDRNMSVEIGFSRGVAIRRFRIWLAGRILYDEIN